MLTIAIVFFTVVALTGLAMASDTSKAVASPIALRISHAGLSCIGSVLVITAAFTGDPRLWINIGLALLIIPLGFLLGYRRSKGIHSRTLAIAHGGVAAVCSAILLYNGFRPL